MSHHDVAVIGAGAAGLAAGLALKASGRSFVVIEARDRIGGRAHTDHLTFPGIPFDRGGHWLHAAATNPFTAIAGRLGFRYKSDIDWSHHVLLTGRGRVAGASRAAAYGRNAGRLFAALDEAGEDGRDVAFSDVIDTSDPWFPLSRRTLAQITSHEPEDCSTLDFARYNDEGGDYPVEDGYGSLVAANARDLKVEFSTPATRIEWSGQCVKIETPRGTITASAAIVAVPVNILASSIVFSPALPLRLQEAIHGCPMGQAEKIALLLDRPVEGFGHVYGDVIDGPPVTAVPFNLHLNPFGRPLVVSHLGGRHALELERLGHAAMLDHAVERLVFAFGSSMRKRVQAGLTTHWTSDPWSLGGYSHARPGLADLRARFSENVGGRLVFAGEHCSQRNYSTIHGAHESGLAATEQAMRLVKGRAG